MVAVSLPTPPTLSDAGQRALEESLGHLGNGADPYADVPPPDELPGHDQDDDDHDSWVPVDLGPYLRGEITRSEPSIGLGRRDGLQMIYGGKEHALIGPTESGKSWFAIGSTMVELMAGNRVVYVHFEEADPGDTIDRLLSLGITGAQMLGGLAFVGPDQRVTKERMACLLDPAPALVVLDGVNEALSLHRWGGGGDGDNDGIAQFRRSLVKPCTKVGAATLACDHVSGNPEGRGLKAIGSVHKINALSGSLIALENVEPFGRGQRGRSHVFVQKDRPGMLRRHGRARPDQPGKAYMGELVVDDTQSRSPDLFLAFFGPKGDQAEDEAVAGTPTVADDVYTVLAAAPDGKVGTVTDLRARMRAAGHKVKNTTLGEALADLTVEGRVEEFEGKRRAVGYRAVSGSHDQPVSGPLSGSHESFPLGKGTGNDSCLSRSRTTGNDSEPLADEQGGEAPVEQTDADEEGTDR